MRSVRLDPVSVCLSVSGIINGFFSRNLGNWSILVLDLSSEFRKSMSKIVNPSTVLEEYRMAMQVLLWYV